MNINKNQVWWVIVWLIGTICGVFPVADLEI